ncbi:MAG TPA: MBL fold metallo-hydrolase [Haliangiales bacterium]|nr:MBL fold metallo-hydrolase [Haliangiales bacterium]
MRIVFLGSGDAFGSGGRFQTCMLVETTATRFLIDCGASSLIAMKRLGISPNGIETIIISHLHGDHFGGLPFLILDAQFFSKRSDPLTVAGPPGLRDRLTAATEVLFPGSSKTAHAFELRAIELEPGRPTELPGLLVTPHVVDHACGAPPFALRIEAEGRVLAYSGDTQWTDALVEAARSADLFICEAYSFDQKIKFHLDLVSLERRLDEIRPKRLILTHMGPGMLARLAEIRHETAEDGKTIEL